MDSSSSDEIDILKVFPGGVHEDGLDGNALWQQHKAELALQREAYRQQKDVLIKHAGKWTAFASGVQVGLYSSKKEALTAGIAAANAANRKASYVTRIGYEYEVDVRSRDEVLLKNGPGELG